MCESTEEKHKISDLTGRTNPQRNRLQSRDTDKEAQRGTQSTCVLCVWMNNKSQYLHVSGGFVWWGHTNSASDSELELRLDSSQPTDMHLSTFEQEKEAVWDRGQRQPAGFHFDQTLAADFTD